MLTRREFISLYASLLGSAAWAAEGPARIVVGFAPGGQIDVIARLLSRHLQGYAASCIVENHPGAGGRLALARLKAARPDGTTSVLTPASMLVLYPHVYRKLGYDPFADFTPVTAVCSFPFLLTTGPLVPASLRTLPDFVAWCRANPKLASFGTAASGSMLHFAGVSLAQAAGIELVHVPYGGPGGLQDLAGGRIALTIYPIGTALPLVQAGQVRALATTGPARSPALPEVPTVAEAGFPAVQSTEWFGLFLPAGTPLRTSEQLNGAVQAAVAAEEVRSAFATMSVDAAVTSPADFGRRLRAEFEHWGPVAQASGFAPEE
jgi:tripartite-type tricarboxylate transporter receptor subunit TctC